MSAENVFKIHSSSLRSQSVTAGGKLGGREWGKSGWCRTVKTFNCILITFLGIPGITFPLLHANKADS